MANRVARIKWDAVTQPDATHYVITAAGTTPGQFTVAGDTFYDVKLDQYLADNQADTFTVYAHRSGANYLDSEPSAAIKIIPNPIKRADGNSKDVIGGQVNVTWAVPGGTTDLTFHHLDLGGDHTGTTWAPSLSGQWSDKSAPMNYADSATFPITGLTVGNIYAITATYIESSGTKVFSGRPVYAWTAKDKPAPDARVATYPYFGHWPDKTYTYRICEDTFPNDPYTDWAGNVSTQKAQWSSLIENAFSQWHSATDGLVSMTRDRTPCAIFEKTQERRNGMTLIMFSAADVSLDINEVYMVDDRLLGGKPFQFTGFIEDIHGLCVFHTGSACAISKAYNNGHVASTELSNAPGSDNAVDILFRKSRFSSGHLTNPTRTAFNQCIPPMGFVDDPNVEDFFAFRTALHEAGHALGSSGAAKLPAALSFIDYFKTIDYRNAHPSIPGAVMNYDTMIAEVGDEPDCSPHPFDIMAMWALYQTVD